MSAALPQPLKCLAYIANARLPTEKAHGLQIVRMCDAFGRLGIDVTLFHPVRHQPGKLGVREVYDYYSLDQTFAVVKVPNIDVVPIERFLPPTAFLGVLFVHGWLWARYGVGVAVRTAPAELYMTRDPAVAAALAVRGLPFVLEVHKAPERRSLVLLRRVVQSPHLRLLVVMTEQLRQALLERGVVAPNVIVEHDAVDAQRFTVAPTDEWESQKPVAVYAGHLFPEKGVGTFVEAGRLLGNVRVKVVGGMPQHVRDWRERIEIDGPPNVEFLGHRDPDRVPSCLKAADVLVVPNSGQHAHSSLYTSPMKLFEYMAAGRPIVACDVPALREVLRHGENAWLVAPDDPRSLAEGIRTVLNDQALAARLAERAASDVRARTWEARAARIVSAAGFTPEAGLISPETFSGQRR